MAKDLAPSLWTQLPSSLIDLLLLKLPVASLLKMRCVCKNWNSFILSSCLCPPPLENLLLYTYVDAPYHLVLNYLNSRTVSWDSRLISLYRFHGGDYPGHVLLPLRAQLAASDGGLLCFGFPYNVRNIVICNPLTKCWRKLQSMGSHKRLRSLTWRVAGMSYDQASGSYKIVVAGFFSDERNEGENQLKATQVYESSTDSWNLNYQMAPVRGGMWSTSVNKAVFNNEYLYVLTSDCWGGRHFLQIFSMKKRTWVEISVHDSVDCNGYAYLIKQQDEIYLVAEAQRKNARFLVFWKLDTSDIDGLWRRSFSIRRTTHNAQVLWLKVRSVSIEKLAALMPLPIEKLVWGCVAHKTTISFLFCSARCVSEVYDILLEHDMSKNSWCHVEMNRQTPGRHICTFEPSYAAVLPE